MSLFFWKEIVSFGKNKEKYKEFFRKIEYTLEECETYEEKTEDRDAVDT